ncbi:uncharacterized protein LOC116163928 [Photinus pyralis]|uniref:uncharacterized protein LOC116163928 n=1 Tax=Photinus pyralis TaxID=7054 RepID=UPI0012675E53|nr:uncharacterized protein LOC116163928 [Photinus pyralis]
MSKEELTEKYHIINIDEAEYKTLSPFTIQRKIFECIGAEIEIKKIGIGLLGVKVGTIEQAVKLKQLESILGTKTTVQPNDRLNKSIGVITCLELASCSEDELKQELKDQGVIDVYKMTKKQGNDRVPSSTIKLTFGKSTLPTTIKAAYLKLQVRPYIGAPRKCFRCQKFGHLTKFCRNVPTCSCGKEQHAESEPCSDPPKCTNCGGPHKSNYVNCPTYVKEKEVMRVQATQKNINFREARVMVYGKSYVVPSETFADRTKNIIKTNTNLNDLVKTTLGNLDGPASRTPFKTPQTPPTASNSNIKQDENTYKCNLSDWSYNQTETDPETESISDADGHSESDKKKTDPPDGQKKKPRGYPKGVPRISQRKDPAVTSYNPDRYKRKSSQSN